MPPIFGNAVLIISILTSLTTIIGTIITFINQYLTYKGQNDFKIKAQRRRITRTIFVFMFLTIISLIVIAVSFPQSSAKSTQLLGTQLYQFQNDESDTVGAIAWAPDSMRIASVGNYDGTIQVWDALTGEHDIIYQPSSVNVHSLSWSSDGKY